MNIKIYWIKITYYKNKNVINNFLTICLKITIQIQIQTQIMNRHIYYKYILNYKETKTLY